MDSVSKQQYDHPLLFFCPWMGFRNKEDEYRFVQFGEVPKLLSDFSDESSFHRRPLELCSNLKGQYGKCRVCTMDLSLGTTYYSCNRCPYTTSSSTTTSFFHKECIMPISNHPYHSKHSLRLVQQWALKLPAIRCVVCSYYNHWFYSCSICDFIMCPSCAMQPPVLTIDHPKRHEHTLFSFLRKESLTCDICALSHHESLIYSCHQCSFVVHKECVYLPYTIRISRHEHRLSFNTSLTPEKWDCGVCRRSIDTNYGRYTCVKGCSYGVHSKCATRGDVWDGIELEGAPEDAYEDVTSFKEISDGVIEHFSHQNHHMRLVSDTSREFSKNKRCQACALPIWDDFIYSCMQCDDFILHQACAHIPRKKRHVMHPHPMSLQVEHQKWCSACDRESNGFMYVCDSAGCEFMLDVCCASISEPFDYQCHPHSLFLTSQFAQVCSICQGIQGSCLNCEECDFSLCPRCATLPNKLRYEHDEHFLILSYNKDASGQYWCDLCEKKAYLNTRGIYMCNDCNVTLHIQCLLGDEELYMMPGRTIVILRRYVNILPNNHLTRTKCTNCHNRCQKKIVFTTQEREMFCSYACLKRIYMF